MTGPDDSEAPPQQDADTEPDGAATPVQRHARDQAGGDRPDRDQPGGEFRDWAAI